VLPGLPAERDGLVVVHASDLHLGTIIGKGWLNSLVERINQMRPDLVVLAGDVVDGNVRKVRPLVDSLSQLRAPMGVYAVTGNHEYYAGAQGSVEFMETAGVTVLRDQSVQVVPGLVLAGVDDLTVRQRSGEGADAVERTLSKRPTGAVILISHSPLQVERAAAAGAGLMLSGHTHAGQIWPFRYLVKLRYPHVSGRYHVNGMDLMVCRGTGTWGPRMRLWKRGELVRITLRSTERRGLEMLPTGMPPNPA
jgi:predicted MPP superfamily phosphohydrolase